MSEQPQNVVDSSNTMHEANSVAAPVTMDSVINWRLIVLGVLFVAVVFVSIKTVTHRHQARTLFVEAQKLEKERDVLAAQWSRLKLEQATVLNQVSVERQARWDLGMKMPKTTEKRMIREPVHAVLENTMIAEDSTVDRLKRGRSAQVATSASKSAPIASSETESGLTRVSFSE